MTILDAKAAVNKEWEKLEKLSAWQMTKVKSKKEVIKNCAFCHADEHLSSSECGERTDISRDKKQALRGNKVNDDSGSNAVFTEQWTLKLPKSACPDTYHGTSGQIKVEHRRSSDSSRTRSVWSPNCQPLVKETLCISSIETGMGKVPKWECLVVHRMQGPFILVGKRGLHENSWKKKQTSTTRGIKLLKLVDLGELTSFLDRVYVGCTQRECKHFRNTNLSRSNLKDTWLWKLARERSRWV